MTLPASAPRHSRPGRLPDGLHYSWVIVGILVVVQVIGSAISQSAGVMVAPLRDPHGAFGWGIGTIGALMAVYYVVGAPRRSATPCWRRRTRCSRGGIGCARAHCNDRAFAPI